MESVNAPNFAETADYIPSIATLLGCTQSWRSNVSAARSFESFQKKTLSCYVKIVYSLVITLILIS